MISIVVIGGLSSVAGAVLGAFFVVGLPKLFDDSVEIGLLTSGAGLLILLLYFPGGLVQVFYSMRDAIFAWVARRLPAEPERAEARAPIPAVAVGVASEPLPEGSTTVIRVSGLTVSLRRPRRRRRRRPRASAAARSSGSSDRTAPARPRS